MMGDIKHETRALFTAALALNTPEERARYLDEVCRDKPEVRERVEALLRAHDQASDFLDINSPERDCVQEVPGTVISHYKLLQQIGEGGFGVVFMAEQLEPIRRRVALKIVKPGMDTKQVVARFEAERQALGMMDHPNVARVLDAGATETGRPYFVMELVKGIAITDYCDREQLSPTDRLRLFMQVCQAVQHAHQKGIIHRDLKPTNILVTVIDGKPVPKIIDFGVAKALGQKLTEKTLYTAFEQIIGTPAYMSPEQAELSGVDVDTRSDIYSLGVLLYELLTGVTPFDAETFRKAGLDEIRRMIRETEPPKPSTRLRTLGEKLTEVAQHRQTEPSALPGLVHGDLDWIVMKALEKDRARRYATAGDMVEDIQRHLDHQPVLASPPGAVYRARKFVRRNRAPVAIAGAVTVALLGGLSLALVGLQRALKAEALMRWQAYASDMKAAQVSLGQNNRGMALNLLSRYLPKRGEEDLRGLEWQYLWQESRPDRHQNFPHPKGVYSAVLSPDGRWLATACQDNKIRVCDVTSARVIREFETRGFRAGAPIALRKAVGFSRDGKRLATLGPDGVEIRETSGWSKVRELRSATAPVVFSADSRFLVTGGTSGMQIWDQTDWSCRVLTNARTTGNAFALAPDAASLACAYYEIDEQAAMAQARVEVWDVRAGTMRVIEGTSHVFSLAISQDGKLLAYGTRLGEVGVWDLSAWRLVLKFTPHLGLVNGLAISPDGKRLATGGIDQQIRIWEIGNTNLLATRTGHLGEIWSLEFSGNGLQLASSSLDGTAKLWDVSPKSVSSRTLTVPTTCEVRGLLPDLSGVLTLDYSLRNLQLWSLAEGQLIWTIPLNRLGPEGLSMSGVCSSPGGQSLVGVTTNGLVCFFNPSTGALVRSVQVAATNWDIYSVSPDQRWVLGYWPNRGGLLCDLRRPSQVKRIPDYDRANSVAGFSPDNRLVAYPTPSHQVIIWDLAANQEKATLKGPRWWIISLTFSPDGRWLAGGGADGDVWLWSTDTAKPFSEAPLKGHMGVVSIVTFSSDSRTLATYGRDRTMRWWNVATGREMLSFPSEPIYGTSVLDFPAPRCSTGRFLLFFERPGSIRTTTVPSLMEIDAIGKGTSDSP